MTRDEAIRTLGAFGYELDAVIDWLREQDKQLPGNWYVKQAAPESRSGIASNHGMSADGEIAAPLPSVGNQSDWPADSPTPEDVERWLALAEAATPGPWRINDRNKYGDLYIGTEDRDWFAMAQALLPGEPMRANATFIAAAREAVPALARALKAEREDSLEQARLLGMSGSREADLLAKLEAAERELKAEREKLKNMEDVFGFELADDGTVTAKAIGKTLAMLGDKAMKTHVAELTARAEAAEREYASDRLAEVERERRDVLVREANLSAAAQKAVEAMAGVEQIHKDSGSSGVYLAVFRVRLVEAALAALRGALEGKP